jgi:hypothetical protein
LLVYFQNLREERHNGCGSVFNIKVRIRIRQFQKCYDPEPEVQNATLLKNNKEKLQLCIRYAE